MDSIRAHIYSVGAILLVLILFSTVFLFRNTAPAKEPAPLRAQAGTGSPVYNPALYTDAQTEESLSVPRKQNDILGEVVASAPFSYTYPGFSKAPENTQVPQNSSFNFNAFEKAPASIVGTAPAGNANDATYAYSFIPHGLINIATPRKTRTSQQDVLFRYGNTIGGMIQSVESAHINSPQVLKEFFDDRTQPAKVSAVVSLGNEYVQLGNKLSTMSDIPSAVGALHQSLAHSYTNIGNKLVELTKTTNDSGLADSVRAYDAIADEHIRLFVAIASLFSAYGVSFGASDPGTIFTFNPQVSL